MTKVRMEHCDVLADLDQIKEFEKLIDATLPQEYIEWLLQYNGGTPVEDSFDFTDLDGRNNGGSVHYFYAIGGEMSYNLTDNFNFLKDRIPSEVISIASESCGNQICLGLRGEYYGKIYFWDHNFEFDTEDGAEQSYDNLFLITNSFSEFVENLYECTIDDNNIIKKFQNGDIAVIPISKK